MSVSLAGRRRRRRLKKAGIWAAAFALIGLCAFALVHFRQGVEARQTQAIRRCVEASATECYALEGSYPPDLAYLQHNYGLVLDTRHYVYRYRVFASNIPPDIFVFRKE